MSNTHYEVPRSRRSREACIEAARLYAILGTYQKVADVMGVSQPTALRWAKTGALLLQVEERNPGTAFAGLPPEGRQPDLRESE